MTIKDYDSIADELDDLLINHAKIIQKRNRHKYKDQNIRDLEKAKWYLDRLIFEYKNM